MTQITCTKLTLLTLAAVVIQIIGLSLFVFGFFPVKPTLSGVSGPESFYAPGCASAGNSTDTLPPHELNSIYQELSGIPPSYDRLVLMVVDALPAEFVLGKDGQPPRKEFMDAMPYTQSLLANGKAIGYHAKAAPPTVTMPRLKAMVSGAIGGYLDVAFNFNTQALLDDNLLGQFLRIGWKMVMLGDDTWLKLFPGLFVRQDGVHSFFVKDTVQVDQNVSRHLGNELSRDDWNLLILHYLGLDHIGHTGGRNSILMAPKLTEMDEVVKMIHLSAIQSQDGGEGQTLLALVSDHGMTESGNHGGSSYEETDSLVLFVGLKNDISDYASATHNTVHQVDIAPTLALLFGAPIPKNNVGFLMSELFDSLTDEKRLRALELNSWQLLRLLKAQLSGLSCGNSRCNGFTDDLESTDEECSGEVESMLCCLYMNASNLHSSWKSKNASGSRSRDDYSSTVAAYYQFLKTASEWLSRKVTDKPVGLLAFGVVTLAVSCVILLSLIARIDREFYPGVQQHVSNDKWCLDETFILGAIMMILMSMGSSSMVEEEQYVWHFIMSTSYLLLLRKTIQYLRGGRASSTLEYFKGRDPANCFQVCSIILLLTSGRILRGWYQGGVNWKHFPDISKWLEHAGSDTIRLIQLISGLLIICLGLFALSFCRSTRGIVLVIGFLFLISGALVMWFIIEYQDNAFVSSGHGANTLAQIIYATMGIATVGVVAVLPWFIPISISRSGNDVNPSTSHASDIQYNFPLLEYRDSSYVIGLAYTLFWCLLQLLLQQPINSMPIFVLLFQILMSMLYYSRNGSAHKEWVEVAMLYFIGMAGHFALGNTNTLATIDVAGAFIGLSSYSTLLSGILMFIITYASPMLVLFSMLIYISVKDISCLATSQTIDSGRILKRMLAFPCLIPLGLNSILLAAYTIVLLLMRNHLFVWSVFSPKYLYVCATTVCIYIGVFVVAVTESYTYWVLALRRRKVQAPSVTASSRIPQAKKSF